MSEKRTVQITADGSATMYSPLYDATYHSKHGAVQESMHVFIKHGLSYMKGQMPNEQLFVFEMGFGTGLNALLTAEYASEQAISVYYEALELHLLSKEELTDVNYNNNKELLDKLHVATWNDAVSISEFFTLKKRETSLLDYAPEKKFHLVYYDAFAPSAQPELWTVEVFRKLYDMLCDGGALVTYCSKSDVRRAMIAAGFTVEKLQGPPGKREMLRAKK